MAVVVPAYNEEDNIGQVLPRIPATVCGLGTAVLVVDDGSRDRTGEIAREHGAAVARHATNLGGGAALRTGYRLMVDSGARIVVTLDADGQHRPEEMDRLVGPVADGDGRPRARLAGARGGRCQHPRARDGDHLLQPARVADHPHQGVGLLERLPRGARHVLPQLVLRQEQFHTSEFMIEAIKRGVPATEVAVTVDRRLHGHSKKPAVLRYGLGFTNAIMRTWLR